MEVSLERLRFSQKSSNQKLLDIHHVKKPNIKTLLISPLWKPAGWSALSQQVLAGVSVCVSWRSEPYKPNIGRDETKLSSWARLSFCFTHLLGLSQRTSTFLGHLTSTLGNSFIFQGEKVAPKNSRRKHASGRRYSHFSLAARIPFTLSQAFAPPSKCLLISLKTYSLGSKIYPK